MIVVKLEIWPYGDESDTSSLGTIEIYNDATGSFTRGNYKYKLKGKKDRVMSEGTVKNYARNAQHPWNLIRQVLDDWKGG